MNQEKEEVNLVEFGGSQRVFGFNGLTEAQINDTTIKRSLDNAKTKGLLNKVGDKYESKNRSR